MGAKTNHNTFNKIAVINDLTGFGRCALSVQIPIISHMGVQCCPVVTSVLSNHSAFDSLHMVDYTENMPAYIEEWRKLGLKFEGVLTGFYGSVGQFDIAQEFIEEFVKPNGIVAIDPIMGDNGKRYSIYDDKLCERMREFVKCADILMPNLTECCILTGDEYDEHMSNNQIRKIYKKLSKLLKRDCKVVITGIKRGNYILNYVSETDIFIKRQIVGQTRCGTGDVFASIIIADAVNGIDFSKSVKKAADFVKKCIVVSDEYNIPVTDGVCFEKVLCKLR